MSDPIFADLDQFDYLPPATTQPKKRTGRKLPPTTKEIAAQAEPWDIQQQEPQFNPRGMMTDTETIIRYVRAGHGKITLQSLKSGTRFTYKIGKPDDDKYVSFFVGLLTGSDNVNDYSYLGAVKNTYNGERFSLTKASKTTADAPSYKAFEYFWHKIITHKRDVNELGIAVWHEGVCCRCGRTLTVPESVAWGIGPECRSKMGL